MPISPTNQDAQPVDAATKAGIERAQAQFVRGAFVTLEQSDSNLKKFIGAWKKNEAEIHPA